MQYEYRFPGFRIKTLTFSYDDGVGEDIRLVDILTKNGLAGTFNLNSSTFGAQGAVHRRLSEEEVRTVYSKPGIEIAVHALTHPHLEREPSNRVMYEIIEDRRRLEAITGRPVTGCAYPYGTYNAEVIEVLRLAGIKYARTTVSTERFDMPQDWLRLPATCHHNSPNLLALGDMFLALQDTAALRYRTQLSMFYVWGHSYEFADRDNWHVIEGFAEKMAGHDDIWYATNGEIYDYMKAIERLEIAVDGSSCHNPTDKAICFYADNVPYTVHPGEYLQIK